MNRAIIGVSLAALLAGSAGAQPSGDRDRDRDNGRQFGGEPTVTLYDGPFFQGQTTNLRGPSDNLNRQGFNDRASSARFVGTWRVCEHANFGGRCEIMQGEVPDFSRYGLADKASSLEPVRGGGGGGGRDDDRPGGGWGGGRDERGVTGTNSVFFAQPQIRGMDIAAGGTAANQYCRRNGLGAAAYYDSSRRAQRAMDPEGRLIGPTPVLSDLVCKRY